MIRTYGDMKLEGGDWKVTVAPYVMIKLKALFSRINKREFGTVTLQNRPEVCLDLEWFESRYPLEMSDDDRRSLKGGCELQRERLDVLEKFRDINYQPDAIPNLLLPLRDYQAQAVQLFWHQGFLLNGDDVGLGKTPYALGAMTRPENLPAVVVCQTHIARQWANEQAPKFLKGIRTHIIKQTKVYDLPPADIYVITYSKLSAWVEYFEDVLRPQTIVFDEVQELRLPGSAKYCAAKRLSEVVPFRTGMSATPIYNYGDEMYHITNIICPGVLGEWEEFQREWCYYAGGKTLIKNTKAFGAYLRDHFIMLARSRKDVGRELPPRTRITQIIPHDQKALDNIKESAIALAKIILAGSFVEKGQASREFDLKLRQATGIAKAPHVADFVRMLAERGQKVLVFAWHRQVYDILNAKLADLRPTMYTSESPAAKAASKAKFMLPFDDPNGANLMFMSLRSAAGLDGLQDVCDVCVYAELDWTPGVHEQCTGRLAREFSDGRTDFNKVTECYLLSDSGSDPVMADILGLKSSQSRGIMTPNEEDIPEVEVDPERMKRLAAEYLKAHCPHDKPLSTEGDGPAAQADGPLPGSPG